VNDRAKEEESAGRHRMIRGAFDIRHQSESTSEVADQRVRDEDGVQGALHVLLGGSFLQERMTKQLVGGRPLVGIVEESQTEKAHEGLAPPGRVLETVVSQTLFAGGGNSNNTRAQ
jgi:hypothetical protein